MGKLSNNKNVLIVSHSFPPLENIAAKRYGFMAKYFPASSWNPWVLTTRSSGLLPVNLPEERIFRLGEHPQKSRLIAKRRAGDHSSGVGRIRRSVGRAFSFRVIPTAGHLLRWHKMAITEQRAILRKMGRIDLIIGSSPPSMSHWIARRYASDLGVPWIADFRDLGALKADYGNKLSIGVDKCAESYLLRSASAITVVTQHWAKMLHASYRKTTRVVYNGWDMSDYPAPANANTEGSPGIAGKYVYYAGRLCQHRMNSVYLLLRALRSFPDVRLVIRSLGPAHLVERLLDEAVSMKLKGQVEILPDVEYSVVLRESQGALANAVFEDIDINNSYSRGTLPGKIYETMCTSPPVLAIARRDSEIGDILSDTWKGQLCSTVKEIETFLNLVINSTRANRPDTRRINMFSRKEQAWNLCNLFDKVIR